MPLCFRSSSNKFVEEAPDADLLSDHRLLVEVGEEALGLVQSDHIVSEATSIPPLEYVHEAVGLNGEARDVPNGRVVVGIEVARATELAKVAHDAPCQRLSVGYEQYSLTAARRCRKVVLPEPYQLRTTSAFFGTVVHDLVGQDLEFPLVRGHPVAWTFGGKDRGFDLGAVLHHVIGKRVLTHVQRRPVVLQHLKVALLRQGEEAPIEQNWLWKAFPRLV